LAAVIAVTCALIEDFGFAAAYTWVGAATRDGCCYSVAGSLDSSSFLISSTVAPVLVCSSAGAAVLAAAAAFYASCISFRLSWYAFQR